MGRLTTSAIVHRRYTTGVTWPEGAARLITEDMLDQPIRLTYTPYSYELLRFAKGGGPYHYTHYHILMDDEVVEFITRRLNPEYVEQWRYVFRG